MSSKLRKLGDVVSIGRPKPRDLRESDSSVSMVPMAAVEEESGRLDPSALITHKEAQRKTLTYFLEGDILFAKVTPCMENGKIAVARGLVGGCGYGSTEFHVLVPSREIDRDYLFHFLVRRSLRGEAQMAMTGAVGLRRVPKVFLEECLIPVPPLDEQRRIVAQLGDQLGRLEATRARLGKTKTQLDAFESSVLASFFSNPEVASDGDAGLSPPLRLGDVATWGSGGTPTAGNPAFYGGSIPWAVIGDLNEGVVTETEKTITELGLRASSAKYVSEGAILIAMYGASIGRLGIAGTKLTTNQAIAHAIVDPEKVNRDYLFHFLRNAKRTLISMGKGGAQSNISQTVLKDYPIVLPPLERQGELVGRLEQVRASLHSVRAQIAHTEMLLESARASGLHRALSGPEGVK